MHDALPAATVRATWILPVVMAAACTTRPPGWPDRPPPEEGYQQDLLAPDEISELGFSAQEAAQWFGNEHTLSLVWSDGLAEPSTELLHVTLGEAYPEVTVSSYDQTTLNYAAPATVSFESAEAVAVGTMSISLAGLDPALVTTTMWSDALVAPKEWRDEAAALAGLEPESTNLVLELHRTTTSGRATIFAAENRLAEAVWACESTECFAWRRLPDVSAD